MEKALQHYNLNKIISLGWTFLVIGLSAWLLGFGETQWQFILIVLIAFGYSHFLIGFFYQCKGFFRKANTWQYLLTFSVLALLSIILAVSLFKYAGAPIALFIGFAYFLLHGLFNEQTLIKREAGIHVPLIYIASLAVFIMSLLVYTVPDPTFLFDRTLEFLSVNDFLLIVTFTSIGISTSVFQYVFWGGMVLSFIILFIAWWQSRFHKLTGFLALSYILIILSTVTMGAMPYVYMYFIVVGYHFMTWFLFYVREMSGRPGHALRDFSILHVLVLIPFIVAGWLFFSDNTPKIVFTLYDYHLFVIATYVHISTSFMNDQWFQNFQNRVFGNQV